MTFFTGLLWPRIDDTPFFLLLISWRSSGTGRGIRRLRYQTGAEFHAAFECEAEAPHVAAVEGRFVSVVKKKGDPATPRAISSRETQRKAPP